MERGKQKFQYLPKAHNNLTEEEAAALMPKETLEVKGELPCPCCGYITIPKGGEDTAYICPVCFWEMDAFLQSEDEPSDQNHGLTLNEARENYRAYGATLERLKQYCRPAKEHEIPHK
ncbi:MAG: hypothetical protein J6A26_03285 [Oscillospiraceae bacterium]|nr:hypothetical protein [Oscillospiraceae bacterium]